MTDPFNALAFILIAAIWIGAIIVRFTDQPRHDASRERANADRRSLSSGAAKPLHNSENAL